MQGTGGSEGEEGFEGLTFGFLMSVPVVEMETQGVERGWSESLRLC